MKQKFTLYIADLQLSVVTDASVEEVEHISGVLDRKMREIYLKSRCPKTEAALLCALEFAADRMTQQTKIAELTDRCEKYEQVVDGLKESHAADADELEALRRENEVLRSLIGKSSETASPDPISPTAFLAEVANAQSQPSDNEPAQVYDPVEDELVPDDAPRGRSRVGSMFDLLSFGETD